MNPEHDSASSFVQFCKLASAERLERFGEALVAEGFTVVRRFLDSFREYLQSYAEDEMNTAGQLVENGVIMLPHPGRISPAWEEVWKEFAGIVRYKNSVLNTIPADRRDGEWQVLLDNPYTNQNIVVYPALLFMEAAYRYAYFRTGLTQNEYIRLQKIETVISDSGEEAEDLASLTGH